jgi:hypothetical protein
MSKVDGKFQFSPISVNFLTEVAKVIFAIVMLVIEVSLCSFMLSSRVCAFIHVGCVQPCYEISIFSTYGLGSWESILRHYFQ